MTFEEKLELAIEVIKVQKLALKSLVPYVVSSRISTASEDQVKTREIASEVAPLVSLTDRKPWTVGMTTNPGDIVLDPLGDYAYIYTGKNEMTHTNPSFYPGSAGVYYWAIIPKTKSLVKVYPGIDGIIVAVKKGEVWWNIDQTQLFSWKGEDNPNCVWPPQEGNEWELVQPED